MATVGSLVIALSLGTAGLTAGLNNVEGQLRSFQSRVNGSAAANAQAMAYENVARAQQQVMLAEKSLQISMLREVEILSMDNAKLSQKAAANLAVEKSTIALTNAQRQLAVAQAQAAAPKVATGGTAGLPFITSALTLAGFALLAFTIGSVKAASTFEAEMRLVQTQAGATRDEVERLSDSVLKMAPDLQTGPQNLAKAMFRVKSVGFEEADALEAVRVSAMGARVGNADLESVTNALIATTISGISGVHGFADAMGLLNGIVGVSNLRMEDLTTSLSSGILSTARQFGLNMLDVGAAMATMSDQGIPAEEASTRLRISIALLGAPTKIATRELESIGLTERSLADAMRGEGGLVSALTLLSEKMKLAGLDATEQSMLLKTAFGGSRSSAGILTLMNSLDLLQRKKVDIEAKRGTFMEDWAAESDTAAARFATLGATVDVLSIRIGNSLMPVAIGLASVLAFVADKTLIVVPAFLLLIGSLTFLAVRATVGAVAGFVKMTAGMISTVVASILMRTSMFNLSVTTLDTAAATGAYTAAAAGTVPASAGAAAGAGGVAAAMGGVAAASVPAVAGLGSVVVAETALVAGSWVAVLTFGQMSEMMLLVAGSTVPMVTGILALESGLVATASTAMLLLPALAGLDAMMVTAAGAGFVLLGSVTSLGAAVVALDGMLLLSAGTIGALGLGLTGLDGVLLTAAYSANALLPAFAGANGIMLTVIGTTAAMITAMGSLSGTLLLTAGSVTPLGLGLLGLDGVMLSIAATAGLMVAPVTGMGVALLEAGGATAPLIGALGALDAEMLITEAGATVLIPTLAGMGPAAGIGAAGVAGLGVAAAAATPPVWTLAAGITLAAIPVYVIVGAIALLVAGIILLLANLDRVHNMLRGTVSGFLELGAVLLDFLSMVPFIGDAFKGAAKSAHDSVASIRKDIKASQDEMNAKSGRGGGLGSDFGDISKIVQAQIDAAKAKAAEGGTSINQTLLEMFGTSLAGVEAAAYAAGAKEMSEYAKGIADNRQAPVSAFSDLTDALAKEMTPQQEIARLVGELQSRELARGLASEDAAVVAAAEALQKSIVEALDDRTNGAYSAGKRMGDNWRDGFRDASLAAGDGSSEVTMAMRAMGPDGGKDIERSFKNITEQWANEFAPTAQEAAAALAQLKSEMGGTANVAEQASQIVAAFGNNLMMLKQIGFTGGADLMLAVADGIKSGRDRVTTELSDLHNIVANQLTQTQQVAYLLAALAGADIVNGLASSDPGVYAQAVATRKIIEDQLDVLTAGAYSRAKMAAAQFGAGFSGIQLSLGINDADLEAGKARYQKFIDSLNSSSVGGTSQAKSDMTTAFNEIKAKAMEYFDAVHSKTLKAISDARDHKNALLDAKEALNQAPVTAAQKALDAQRKAIQEWRLRQAVANATSPEEQRDAILALRDFLAQQHVDAMQDEADAANDVIDAQRKKNNDLYDAQVEAENKRYAQQKKDFERQLTALERYLKNHPKEWAKTQNQVLALLASYGVTYKNAGSLLGSDFVQGLQEQVKAAKAAGDALAAAAKPGGTGATPPPPGGGAAPRMTGGEWWNPDYLTLVQKELAQHKDLNGNGIIGYASGAYDLQNDQIAMVHAREMILRASIASGVRRAMGTRPMDDLPGLVTAGAALENATQRGEVPEGRVRVGSGFAGGSGGGSGGQTTVIFKVGDETFGEIADMALYQQDQRQRRTSVTRVGGSRR